MTMKPEHLRDDAGPTLGIAEQFLADFLLLPAEKQLHLVQGLAGDETLPTEKLRAYIRTRPRAIARLYGQMLADLPFGKLLRPLSVLYLSHDRGILYIKKAAEVLGNARAFLLVDAVHYVHTAKEDLDGKVLAMRFAESDIQRQAPEQAACDALSAEWMAELVMVSEVLENRLPKGFAAMEARVRSTEQAMETAKAKSAENQAREAKAHARGKEKAAAEAKAAAMAEAARQLAAVQAELSLARQAQADAEGKLQVALGRIAEIEEGGGATPERLKEIEAAMAAQAEERVRSEVSAQVRPWLARLEAMVAEQADLREADELSLVAVEEAMREATGNDLLLSWQENRLKALPVIEARLERMDALMATMLAPSEKLKRLHDKLRSAVLSCRKAARPSEPLGGLVAAMLAGVKSAKDVDMVPIVAAFESLKNAGVLDKDEAESLMRSVNQERQLRLDRSTEKQSTRALVAREIYAKHPVDIYVDAYNFMHTVNQHFGKYGKESTVHKGKRTFGPDARNHLAEMVKGLHEHNVGCRVFLFLDGKNVENLKPFPGVRFILPTQQTHGSGQADEEILHYIKKNHRPDALVCVVTNDKAVQAIADKHLSPGEFASLLEEIS